jgi:integrase
MEQQDRDRLLAGEVWQEHGLVFASRAGTPLSANNVIRAFRIITKKAGLGEDWVPREMRHTFVSVLSANCVPWKASPCSPDMNARPRLSRSTATRSDPRSPKAQK